MSTFGISKGDYRNAKGGNERIFVSDSRLVTKTKQAQKTKMSLRTRALGAIQNNTRCKCVRDARILRELFDECDKLTDESNKFRKQRGKLMKDRARAREQTYSLGVIVDNLKSTIDTIKAQSVFDESELVNTYMRDLVACHVELSRLTRVLFQDNQDALDHSSPILASQDVNHSVSATNGNSECE